MYFNRNKGIIRVRNMFLKEISGLESFVGDAVVKLTRELNSEILTSQPAVDSSEKILLMPVATIGAGKTTLARMMMSLFPSMGHVQNDNIIGKKPAAAFESSIMDHFRTCNVVFAGIKYLT
jgi:tRNA ligase